MPSIEQLRETDAVQSQAVNSDPVLARCSTMPRGFAKVAAGAFEGAQFDSEAR